MSSLSADNDVSAVSGAAVVASVSNEPISNLSAATGGSGSAAATATTTTVAGISAAAAGPAPPPISVSRSVASAMATALPDGFTANRESKDCLSDCLVEFVGFVASEASDARQRLDTKSITGDAMVHAFLAVGMDPYYTASRAYLDQLRKNKT